MDKYYNKWARYLLFCRDRRRKERLATKFYVKCIVNWATLAFYGWKTHTKEKKRRNHTEKFIQKTIQTNKFRELMDNLKVNRIRGLKIKFKDLYHEFEVLKTQMKKNIEYTNESDGERVQLIGNLETLSINIDHLQQELFKKNKEIENLNEAVVYKTESEERINRALQKNIVELDELSRNFAVLTEEHNRKCHEYSRLHDQSKTEKERLIIALQSAQSESEKKQDIIYELQNENRKNIEALSSLTVENGTTVKQLESELRQIKDAYHHTKDELTRANELLGRYEDSNSDLKQKVAQTYKELESSSMRYADTIQSLEIKVHSLSDEVNLLRRDKEFNIKEIQDLKELLRSYEVQVERMTEAQHRDTEGFIQTLHKHKREPSSGPYLQKLRPDLSFQQSLSNSNSLGIQRLSMETDPNTKVQISPSFFSPRGSPIKNFVTQRNKKGDESEGIEERFSIKGSIKKQFNTERVRTEPNLNMGSPIQDIQRNIDKLKLNKKSILENIEQRTRNLREAMRK